MLRTCHDPPVRLICCRERYKERDRSRSVYYRVIGCSKRLHGFNSSAVEYNLFDQLLLISEAGHLLEKLQAAWARCGWKDLLMAWLRCASWNAELELDIVKAR
ncbi:hypothetical protein PC112_g11847 [Phytophthora cactorum]|nr:hypothetical protein PC112_g11847 [Phytophthora cactorum]